MGCISYFKKVAKDLGLIAPYTSEDISMAETENVLLDHQRAVERIKENLGQFTKSDEKLLQSIRTYRSGAFADLESSMQNWSHH